MMALIVDPAGRVPRTVEPALTAGGYLPCRETLLPRALLELFKSIVPLVVLGHCPPSLDAVAFLRVLRRAPDCASRRTQIFVALPPEAPAGLVTALRDGGASQVSVAALDAARLQAMLVAMRDDTRRFIDAETYVGPDRRVKQLTSFGFTLKRRKDYEPRASAYTVALPPRLMRADPGSAGRPRFANLEKSVRR
jgi:hypothetical protein